MTAQNRDDSTSPRGSEPLTFDASNLLRAMAQSATGLWRARRKLLTGRDDSSPYASAAPQAADLLAGVARHIESAWDALLAAGVEVRDDTGKPYVSGMSLHVIAFQPTPGARSETVAETVKPSIFYLGHLIQPGEVVGAIPTDSRPPADTRGVP